MTSIIIVDKKVKTYFLLTYEFSGVDYCYALKFVNSYYSNHHAKFEIERIILITKLLLSYRRKDEWTEGRTKDSNYKKSLALKT